jgi:hypothetical protein
MTQDIIAMAREAGIKSGDIYKLTVGHMSIETLERFAALAQAAERNKLASWMMAKGYATGHGDTIEGLLEELEREVGFKRAELWIKRISEAVLAEREACAKVCDHMAARCNDIRAAALESAAENIRSRGDKT